MLYLYNIFMKNQKGESYIMAVYIDMDDQNQTPEEEESIGGAKLEKLKAKKLSMKIPERRIQQFLDEYDCVVVNDFGDLYHMSEEERTRNNRFYEIFKEVKGYKNSYRHIEEYITVVRKVLKCLDDFAKVNMAMPPEKFKKAYLRGDIYITGLRFPKYKGKDKKNINSEYLTEFILSDKDPSEFYQKSEIYLTDDEIKEQATDYFTPEELNKICNTVDENANKFGTYYFDPKEDETYGMNVAVDLSQRESRKLLNKTPELALAIDNMDKIARQKNNLLNSIGAYASDFTADDIEAIAEYDQRNTYIKANKIPKFKGNLNSNKDYDRYMQKLKEFDESHTRTLYKGKLKTKEEIEEIELNGVLEDNGWNIRKLWGYEEEYKKMKKIDKLDEQRYKETKKKLLKIDYQRRLRNGDKDAEKEYQKELADLDKETKKKKGKGKGKNKNKKFKFDDSKSNKRTEKLVSKKQKELRDDADDFISNIITGTDEDDFKDYKKESLNWKGLFN